VSTGPLQAVVPQWAALPWLPSSTGLETPEAGSMLNGVDDDVPVGFTVQLPT
jgi:hypothetical protein